MQDGKRHFPSSEESEYTAELCFAIATAASWWAVRVGHAKLYVPRSPSPSCTGHRDHWLDLDPRALREWAMTPLAISLGLRPLDTAEAARVPTRACVEDVLQQAGCTPPWSCVRGAGESYPPPTYHQMEVSMAGWSELHPSRLGPLLCPIHQGDTLVRVG